MIAIIDYGAGNLFSVKNALDYIGYDSVITNDPIEIERADELILPGVGAFPDAMKKLKRSGMAEILPLQAKKKPLLGICLGMQALFETGYEFEETRGLGLIPGTVSKIVFDGGISYKLPHIGWNQLEITQDSPLLKGISSGDCVYFVHSFAAHTPEKYLAAYCDYCTKVTAFVQHGLVFGAQFHPEKSGEVGLTILKNFGGLV